MFLSSNNLPKILLTNIQSLKPKLDELSLVVSNNLPDIVCLTETWLSPEIESNLVDISSFSLIRNDRKLKRVGGTAVYIRENLPFEVIDVEKHLTNDIEASFVDLPSNNLSILCIYVPPQLNAPSLRIVREQIAAVLDQHLSRYFDRHFIVLGDLNHLNAEWLTSDFNLSDIVKQPTRGRNTLDHILISHNLKSIYLAPNVSYESPIGNSDHLTLLLTPVNEQQNLNDIRKHTVLDYRRSNINTLLRNAESLDWEHLIDPNDDVNQQWKNLHCTISTLIDQSLPSRAVYLTSKDKPWMTPVTKLLINDKWSAYRSKDWKRYSFLKVKVREEIVKAKATWTEKMKATPHGLWKAVRHLSGKNNRHELSNLITQHRSPLRLAEDIAASMEQEGSLPRVLSFEDDEWSLEITQLEVEWHLRKLDPKKAMGSDLIPNKIYSLLAPFIAGPLKTIFECSIDQRIFPSDWKKAIIVPIPKTHPPKIEKLRTISLLPSPAKILEKLVLSKLYSTLESLFGTNQHAFRKSASTTTALLQITDTLTRTFDDFSTAGFGILSLDFSKAFDKVQHSTLLRKILNSCLPRGFALWLHSYLSNRSFRVKIHGQLSVFYSLHTFWSPTGIGAWTCSFLNPCWRPTP